VLLECTVYKKQGMNDDRVPHMGFSRDDKHGRRG
jgi:hypothetical protein